MKLGLTLIRASGSVGTDSRDGSSGAAIGSHSSYWYSLAHTLVLVRTIRVSNLRSGQDLHPEPVPVQYPLHPVELVEQVSALVPILIHWDVGLGTAVAADERGALVGGGERVLVAAVVGEAGLGTKSAQATVRFAVARLGSASRSRGGPPCSMEPQWSGRSRCARAMWAATLGNSASRIP
jgi:hypothetical protein